MKKKKIGTRKKVFVSGCYDILHAGHIQFFKDAKVHGGHLTVCFASDAVLKLYKHRRSSLPEDNKALILGSLDMVDEVVKSSDLDPVFDFAGHIKRLRPDILAVTDDDKHIPEKQKFCDERGIKLAVLPKRNPATKVSTSSIIAGIKEQSDSKKKT